MAVKAVVQESSLQRVLRALQFWRRKHAPARFVVGYGARYAVYVHENLRARHTRGQAKFLEEPARKQSRAVAAVVRDATRRGETLEQGLQRGAEFLLAESRKLVPVDTGHLRESGFVRREDAR